jgi:glycosyltransferase involved in cell wall biosynthesis
VLTNHELPLLTVIAPDPAFGGGGSAQTEAFVEGARELGRGAAVVWVPHPALAGRRLSIDRVEAIRQLRGGRALARRLDGEEPLWVVSTMAQAGYAATISGAAYSCWIGTTVDDEWAGRRRGLGMLRRAAFGLSLPTVRRLERDVLRGARRVYATSTGSRDAIARASGLTDVDVLPIPVDIDRFTPEPDETWIARLERPVLAFVGRAWDPRKNVSLLLEALPILRRRIPDARLRLIGEPPAGALPDGVEVTGAVADVAPHLRTASLFVLPSHQEGFGIVAAEALACGVPVLSTRSHGPEELIERSGAGRLLDTFRPDELAAAAGELLGDVATLTAMRKRGREYVEQQHAPAAFRLLLERALAE